MKLLYSIAFAFFLCSSFSSFAQPRWSPEIRSKREMAWMNDSLSLTKSQENKITAISLNYQREMDKAAESEGPKKAKRQHQLMRQKDADLKTILNKKQFDTYYRRELFIRQVQNDRHYDKDRQPN